MAARDHGRQAACDHVYRRFRSLQGVRPTAAHVGDHWVYTFDKTMSTSPDGPRLRQVVRVTVDEAGRVVKVVASR